MFIALVPSLSEVPPLISARKTNKWSKLFFIYLLLLLLLGFYGYECDQETNEDNTFSRIE